MDLPPFRWLSSTVLVPTAALVGAALAAGVKATAWGVALDDNATFASLVAALVMVIALSALLAAFAGLGHGALKARASEAFFEGSARGGVVGLVGIASFLSVLLAISYAQGSDLLLFSGAPAASYFLLMTVLLMIIVGGTGALIGQRAVADGVAPGPAPAGGDAAAEETPAPQSES